MRSNESYLLHFRDDIFRFSEFGVSLLQTMMATITKYQGNITYFPELDFSRLSPSSVYLWETRVLSLGQEDPLEKEIATHPSFLEWKIPWAEEPGRLQSVGSQRVRRD